LWQLKKICIIVYVLYKWKVNKGALWQALKLKEAGLQNEE